MEENKNNNENQEPQRYSGGSGTGVISSIIFTAIALVAMILLSKYLGN